MVRGFLFDIEGMLVGDKRYQPTPGAVEFVRLLRQRGLPLRLITNNTTYRPEEILARLRAAGFDFAPRELVTCVGAAARLLQGRGVRRCQVIGTDALQAMLREAGLEVRPEPDVDAVVVGLDFALTYETLRTATEALVRHGAVLVALHRNRILHDEQGRIAPSVGAIVAALAYAADVDPIVVGKPSPDYFRQALVGLDVPTDQIMVVSDDPMTDLAGAKRLGMQTAFVLVGKYRDRSVLDRLPPEDHPDLIVDRIDALAAQLPPS